MSQFEVITRVARRRRFTIAERAEILAEVDASSIAKVCRKRDLSRSLIQRWRKLEPSGSSSAELHLPPAALVPPPTSAILMQLPGGVAAVFPAGIDSSRTVL